MGLVKRRLFRSCDKLMPTARASHRVLFFHHYPTSQHLLLLISHRIEILPYRESLQRDVAGATNAASMGHRERHSNAQVSTAGAISLESLTSSEK